VTLLISIARRRLPDYVAMITFGNLGLAVVMAVLIATLSTCRSLRRVLKIEFCDMFLG
jgi:putative ABC transport system permease protein